MCNLRVWIAGASDRLRQVFDRLYRSLFGFVAVSALALGTALVAFPQRNEPSAREWKWTDQAWAKLLKDFIPSKTDAGYYVSFRATQSLHAYQNEAPEWCVVIGPDPKANAPGVNNFVSAHFRIADSTSIYDQIMVMHRRKPGESLEEIRKRIKVKSIDLTESTCPDVKTMFHNFQELRFGAPKMGVEDDAVTVYLDPPVYEIHIRAAAGDVDMTLYDDSHPLVVWAMDLRARLEACTGANTRPSVKK